MRRVVGSMAVAAAALLSTAGPVSADPADTFVLRFTGRAGSALLTDCPATPVAGVQCRAVSVFAVEERVNIDGEQIGGPRVNVTLYDVTTLAEAPYFEAVAVGAGFTDAADVRIAPNLKQGSVATTTVGLCEFFACEPGASESLTIAVEWEGVGLTSTFKSHDRWTDPFCSVNSHSNGSFRAASAVGVLDGVPVAQTVLPQFGATLQTDRFGTVERCG